MQKKVHFYSAESQHLTGGQSPCEVIAQKKMSEGISGVAYDSEADTRHAGKLTDTATILFGFT